MPVASAVAWPDGKAYVFHPGDTYDRYDIASGLVERQGAPVSDWPGLPGSPDAFLWWGARKAVAFYGGDYVRYDAIGGCADEGYDPPRVARTNFPGMDELPQRWSAGFDAAVNWGSGQTFLFRGAELVKFDISDDRVAPGYPRPIADVFPGVFPDGVDAVLYPGGRFAFFVRGEEFQRYDVDTESVEPPASLSAFDLTPGPGGGCTPARQLDREDATAVLADLVHRGLLTVEGGLPSPGGPVAISATEVNGVTFTDATDPTEKVVGPIDQRLAVALYRLTRWMSSRDPIVREIFFFPVGEAVRSIDLAGFAGEVDGVSFTKMVDRDWGYLPAVTDGGVRLDAIADPIADDLFRLAYGFGTYECESSALGVENGFPPLLLGQAGYVITPDYSGDPTVRAAHQDRIHLQIGASS